MEEKELIAIQLSGNSIYLFAVGTLPGNRTPQWKEGNAA